MRYIAALCCAVVGLSAVPVAADEDHHARHEHVAPHGGTLVVLGDEFVHLELLVDPETGKMTAYVLDGEAERGVRVRQSSLEIDIQPEEGASFVVALAPVANVLTGEVEGHTSQFAGRSDRLKRMPHFQGEIREIEVRGQRFQHVSFRFPEGNEDPHHEEHS